MNHDENNDICCGFKILMIQRSSSYDITIKALLNGQNKHVGWIALLFFFSYIGIESQKHLVHTQLQSVEYRYSHHVARLTNLTIFHQQAQKL